MKLTLANLLKFDLLDKAQEQVIGDPVRLSEFFRAVQGISTTDRFIRDCPAFPGSTDTIVRSEMISAIGSTLAIEGRNLTADEIEASLEKADRDEDLRRPEQEAQNARKVYDFIRDLLYGTQPGTFQYTEAMIKQIHRLFTDGLNYLGNIPGQYRGDFPARFGDPRRMGLCRTSAEVADAMGKFVEWLNRIEEDGAGNFITGDQIAKAIMAHCYLTEIHPFGDGNGRTARALEALVLYANGINVYCFWSLANFWSTHRGEYITSLGRIFTESDPWPLLIWGMQGYHNEILRIKSLVLKKVRQLMLRDYTKYLLEQKSRQEIKINQRITHLVTLLTRWGDMPLADFLASPEVSALYQGWTTQTQRRDLDKMKRLGLVKMIRSPNDNKFIVGPNYERLEYLTYNV